MYTSQEIYHILHNVLLKQWDPINIKDVPECADEYDNYIPNLYNIIRYASDESAVFNYLWFLETNYIGITVTDNNRAKEHTMMLAQELFKLQKWVEINYTKQKSDITLHQDGYHILYQNKRIGKLLNPMFLDDDKIRFNLDTSIWNMFKSKKLYDINLWTLQLDSANSNQITRLYSKNRFYKLSFEEIKTKKMVEFYLDTHIQDDNGIVTYLDTIKFKPQQVILYGPYQVCDDIEPPWVMGAEYPPGDIVWRMEYEAWFYHVWKWSFDFLDKEGKLAYLKRWNTPANWRTFLFEYYYDLPTLISYLEIYPDSEYLFFWGHQGGLDKISHTCLSQWYEAPFIVDGISYKTAEHYMMAEKARLFNDENMLNKILLANNADEVKKLGREVKNFDSFIWQEKRIKIVYTANVAKFSQNPALKEFLIGTYNKILVEASPNDSIWGIGIAANHKYAKQPENWPGSNLLGFILMQVRDNL